MKAVRVHEYGGPEVLQVEEIERKEPQDGELLVQVLACGINPLDAWFRSGHFAARFQRPMPYTPGTDVVGTVAALGKDTTGFAVGDLVMGILTPVVDGGYAEYAIVPANRTAAVPDGLAPVSAAAALTPVVTGLQFADKAFALRDCRHVLVLGALGAVGRAAIARALAKGVEVTAGVRAGQEDEALKLGATRAVAVGDGAIIDASGPLYDCIIDGIGPEAVAPWESRIVEGGLVISIVPLPPAAFARTDIETVAFAFSPDPASIREAALLMLATPTLIGKLETLALDETGKAHAVLPRGGGGRKFVVVPGLSPAASGV